MKPLERDRRRDGRSRYRTASTDRASRPIDLPQQMVGWDMVFQAEVLEQPLRRRLPPQLSGRVPTPRRCPTSRLPQKRKRAASFRKRYACVVRS
jgi:hypothetical protein